MVRDLLMEPLRATAFDLLTALQMVTLVLPMETERGAEMAVLFAECARYIYFGL